MAKFDENDMAEALVDLRSIIKNQYYSLEYVIDEFCDASCDNTFFDSLIYLRDSLQVCNEIIAKVI